MSVTAYCKKCGQDVPVGDFCPQCGRKLTKASLRTAWCVEYEPVRDWMRWNSAARIILPAAAAVIIIVMTSEGIAGGMDAIVRLLNVGFIGMVFGLLGLIGFMLLCILRLQGESIMDCVMDSKGVHVQEYLLDPTPLKLLMRMRSPSMMENADMEAEEPMLLVAQKEIAWRDITRVQLWPEKQLILLYAPRWWMRMAVYASPVSWDGALEYMRGKIGKKKNVILPYDLTAQTYTPVQDDHARQEVQTEQLSLMDGLPPVQDAAAAETAQEEQNTNTPEAAAE